MDFKLVCKTTSMPFGTMARFNIGGNSLLLYHLNAGFFATQNRCSHLFGSLEKGEILDSCKIQCRYHHATFDIKTGKVIKWANFPTGIQVMNFIRGAKNLKTFRTKIEDNNVYVEI